MSSSKEQQLWEACTVGNLELVKLLLSDPVVDVNCGDTELQRTPFYRACGHGKVSVVEFLLKHPMIDVNKPMNDGATPFSIACFQGNLEVVKLLLADRRIDVNKPQNSGATPFLFSCQKGQVEVVKLLLADERVNLNEPEDRQCTPLWFASQDGYLLVVQLLLASERAIDTKPKSIDGNTGWNNKTAAEFARFQASRAIYDNESEEEYVRKKQNGPVIADLIDSFDHDPFTTRQQLRELPENRDPFISDLFALVVFLCDGLLKVAAESSTSSQEAARFFLIARELPLELQMVLCNRVFGAGKDMVLTKHSEPAFKRLGKFLALKE